MLAEISYKRCTKALETTVDLLSPEQPVPKGHDGGGVEGTDKYEQQQIETHHDGEVVSEEPGGAAGVSEEGSTLTLQQELHNTIL